MAIIELNNVTFSVQSRTIVENVSLAFDESKTTALIGPSGGGKSTILKLAAGLLVPNRGDVFFKGKSIAQMNRVENLEFRRKGAFVFQDSALWANQNLDQILELPLRIHYPHMTRDERVMRIKEVVAEAGYKRDLDIRPAVLSMGEQKLVAFARAMLCKPNLLFLDEWTESLDENSANRLISLVRLKQKEKATVLFISHDMRIIKDMADVIIIITDGKVSFKTTKEQIEKDSELITFLKTEIAS
jgi:ABC-type multidrug transport system ATPase subunit